jgi:hypothetical protein
MMLFGKKDPEGRVFGTSPGDLGVIAIALLFTCAGIYLCFVSFRVPPPAKVKPASEVSVSIAPAKSAP